MALNYGVQLWWSGKNKDECCLSLVGFMIKTSITRKLQNLPVGHSDRIMSLRLPVQENKCATVLSVWAPTLQAATGVKEAFYHDLLNLLQQVDSKDKLLILGDFNARVGWDFKLWKGVLDRHGTGNCNDIRCMLLEFCSEHQLVITSTLFRQNDKFKATWRHPHSKHWHLLGYVLTRQQDTRDALHTRVMPSADCYTDHMLVCCKVTFSFKSPPKRKGPQTKKLQVHKVHDPRVENNLQVMLEERLHCATTAEPGEQWKQMKTILQETMAEAVDLSTRKHQDWFDEAGKEIKELLEKKCSCHSHLLAKPDDQAAKAAYKTACSTLQAKFRIMQNDWWTELAKRTQRYAGMGDMCAFYTAVTSDPSPTTLFGWKYPADRQGSHSPALVTAFWGPLQWPTHCAGVITSQDSPSGCEAGAG